MVALNDVYQVPVVSQVYLKVPLHTICDEVGPPNTVAYLPVKSNFVGPGVITPTRRNAKAWLANGIFNFSRTDCNSPACFQLSNFGEELLTISKGMVVASLQHLSLVLSLPLPLKPKEMKVGRKRSTPHIYKQTSPPNPSTC